MTIIYCDACGVGPEAVYRQAVSIDNKHYDLCSACRQKFMSIVTHHQWTLPQMVTK